MTLIRALVFLLIFPLSATLSASPEMAIQEQLLVSMYGDIWLVSFDIDKPKKAKWEQLTSGLEEDRFPVWHKEGARILFASRKGDQVFDLWLLDLQSGERRPWHQSTKHDTAPTIAQDGTVVWVKGIGPSAKLWRQKPGQKAKKLSTLKGAEHSPSISQDGQYIVFIQEANGKYQLMRRDQNGQLKTLLTTNTPVLPQIQPGGNSILYSTITGRKGLWHTDMEGRFHNLLSTQQSQGIWSANGDKIILQALKARPPYHNGDQDVQGERYLEPLQKSPRAFGVIDAPTLPDASLTNLSIAVPSSNQTQFHSYFLDLMDRLEDQYLMAEPSQQSKWKLFRQKYQGQITAIQSQEAADQLEQEILAERPFLRAELSGQAAVSSAHPLASQAGQKILAQGGNVVDAAVAVSFALGVVEPDASGLGGYGEMLIYLKEMDAPTCIEFLTRVPEAASLSNGDLNPLPKGGPIMVNIPGTVAGMEKAWKKYGSGKVDWAEIVAPAIELAEKGFKMDASFATTLMKEQDQYRKYPSSLALFFPDGQALQPGELFKNSDLAWTLKEIAKGGAKAFYQGVIADRMVKDLTSQGNVMTKQDMARYYAVEREPVSTTYRGHSVYSGPPPVSGGAYLIGQLNQLEQLDAEQLNDEEIYLHAMIEAWKMAPSGRGKIADPGLWPVDLSDFYDKDAAARRWSNCFNPMSALLPQQACKDTRNSAWGAEKVLESTSNTGTTSFSVADAEGNMVAVTQTLGTWGGNFYVTPGLGFLYNDKLGSYGRNPKGFNARIPFARNVTSITPTLVFKGTGKEKTPLLTVGAAGNAWITSAVYRIITAVVDQGKSPQAAIEQARFLVGVRRDPKHPEIIQSLSIQVEDAFAPGFLQKLEEKGHSFQRISNRGGLRMGYASAILIGDKKVIAGADPRRSGQAKVIN